MSLFKITVSVLAVGASACTKDADCTTPEMNKCLGVYTAEGPKKKTCSNETAAKAANDAVVEERVASK